MSADVTLDHHGRRDVSGLPDFVSSLAGDDEPGVAVGVYSAGELVGSATAGCAVPEHSVPVNEQTAFDIASVSKHMTSACMLLLARDGLVDLDSDIRASLPELALTQPVTLRQCLTHTAGLRDYLALCELAGIPVLGISEDRAMDLITGQRELDFGPGSAFSYSNTGYVLAAALVRGITGAGLARFASERLFGPLGMTVTHFRDDVALLVPRLANGYLAAPAPAPGAGFRRNDVTETVVGDGAVVTSLADLAAWHGFMAEGTVLGVDIRVCYGAVTGVQVPRAHAAREASDLAGLWHEPAQDLFMRLEARDGQITVHEQGAEHVFALRADGRWHGAGVAAGSTFTAGDGTFTAGWGLSASLTDRYVRAEPGPRRPSSHELPAWNFVNKESRASASLRVGDAGGAEIAIGLAPPPRLVAAGQASGAPTAAAK